MGTSKPPHPQRWQLCSSLIHPSGGNSRFRDMKTKLQTLWQRQQEGKAGWIFLWLLGVPIPVLIILFLMRGCT